MVKITRLAGRLRWEAVALYSFPGTLHSVRKSIASANRFMNACWAACIASAAFMPVSRMRSRTDLGTSSQSPVVSLCHGGVSRSTASMIALFLHLLVQKLSQQETKYIPQLEIPFDFTSGSVRCWDGCAYRRPE